MIKTVKGQKPSRDRKLLPLEYRLHMLIVKTLLLLPSLKCALGRCVEDLGLTPPKKIKVIQCYCPEYHERWSCLLLSRKGDSFVLCTVCNIDFACAHGGGNDCKRHVESISHKDYESLKKSQPFLFKVSGSKAR